MSKDIEALVQMRLAAALKAKKQGDTVGNAPKAALRWARQPERRHHVTRAAAARCVQQRIALEFASRNHAVMVLALVLVLDWYW
jgi:hypothetical protein